MSVIKQPQQTGKAEGLLNHSSQVSYYEVDQADDGQRLDNFLLKYLKTVPRSHIYRIIRTGQVRVNKKRAKPTQRLTLGDAVRIPPVIQAKSPARPYSISTAVLERLSQSVLYEDDQLLAINKASAMPVHAGTGASYGVIEGLRQLRPELKFLELVHRLDRDTSGCLLLAKQRSVLIHLHRLMRAGHIEKEYLALLKGRLQQDLVVIKKPLLSNQLQGDERMVVVDELGKMAETHLHLLERYADSSLVKIRLLTGRKHQIRVHAAAIGHPVAADAKYGDKPFNQVMRGYQLKRLFLHAHAIRFELDRVYEFIAPLPEELSAGLNNLPK